MSATFYGYIVYCDCGSYNVGCIPNSDEYGAYRDSEKFECFTCGNEFRVYTP